MSNCLTISQTCSHYLLSRGFAINPFEVVCEEGDAAVIGRVDISYFDTSR